MKLSTLLSALLLSAAPALADEFVYLECVSKEVIIKKDLKSNQITKKEEATKTSHTKVDLANSRLMAAENPQWRQVDMVNGTVVIDHQVTANGLTASIKANMQLVPPGRITTNFLERNDDYSTSIKMTGMCKEVDASVFEKALKESES